MCNSGIEAWERGSLEDFGILIAASGRSSIQNYECGITLTPTLFIDIF